MRLRVFVLFLCFAISFSAFAKDGCPQFGLDESLLIDASSSSDTLVLAFGGMRLRMGISIFEFRKILSNFDAKHLFVKDYQRKFYQYGLLPGGNVTQALNLIEEAIEKIGPKRIVVIGNSGGGHAALLFGFLLLKDGFPVEKIHAFVPRFRVEKEFLEYPHIQPEYFELKEVFEGYPVAPGIFHLHYGYILIRFDFGKFLTKNSSPPAALSSSGDSMESTSSSALHPERLFRPSFPKFKPPEYNSKEDVGYALKLRKFQWIKFYGYQGQAHDLIKVLKERGDLYQIIKSMIGLEMR